MVRKLTLCKVAILAIIALAQPSLATESAETCYLDGWGNALRCYRISVPDGAHEQKLAVMVAPALNDSGNAPMYLLAGGPGQAASDLVPLLGAFSKLNRQRDIVMVDRRGGGLSGAFECGLEAEMPASLEEFAGLLADCYRQRPEFAETLNSRRTVEDLELVRETLGHEQIVLWGGSWGTRTALLYQQWHPEAISALVLDAVAPIETKVFLSAQAAEQALQQLQNACAEDRSCAAFGDWRGDLDRLLAEWEQGDARLADPLTGKPVERKVPRWEVANAIRAALYDPAAAAQLPYAIHQAARGNLLPLSGLSSLFLPAADTMSMGLTFSVACAEELNRISPAEIAGDSRNTFLGTGFIDLFRSGCAVWPVRPKPYSAPEPRDQPVLLISGSADPITPPGYADTRLDYLTHKQHLVVKGGGHINSRRGCIPDLIASFLDNPGEALDSQCVDEIRRPPFMAGAFGPALDVEPLARREEVQQ